MTAAALPRRRKSPVLFILALVVIILAIANVIPSVHANTKHAECAEQVRQAPALQTWINSSLQRYNVIKDLGDGSCGIQVLYPDRCGIIHEITAYVFTWGNKNDLEAARAMLKSKGCVLVWEK